LSGYAVPAAVDDGSGLTAGETDFTKLGWPDCQRDRFYLLGLAGLTAGDIDFILSLAGLTAGETDST
jgi:hypothetical protein